MMTPPVGDVIVQQGASWWLVLALGAFAFFLIWTPALGPTIKGWFKKK